VLKEEHPSEPAVSSAQASPSSAPSAATGENGNRAQAQHEALAASKAGQLFKDDHAQFYEWLRKLNACRVGAAIQELLETVVVLAEEPQLIPMDASTNIANTVTHLYDHVSCACCCSTPLLCYLRRRSAGA
jgi:hypothetical protein